MTSLSLALYHGAEKRWQAVSARAYVLLDIADRKSEPAARALRGKPGVVIVDLLEGPPHVIMVVEAPDRQKLAEVTIQALASGETMTEGLRLLPAQYGQKEGA